MIAPATRPSTVIEVFADVRCPFAHVGLRRLVDRAERRPRSPILVKAWPLELVNGVPLDATLIAEEVDALRAQVAPDLFTGFDPDRFPATSMPALALTAAATRIRPEIGERVALALRWALFEEGRDIARPDVLLDIAESAGIGLPTNGGIEEVEADWHEGARRGVIGSPHFFVGDQDFFCPTLDIARVDGRLQVSTNESVFDAFVARALRS